MEVKIQEVKKATPKVVLPEWMEEMQQGLEQTYLQAGAMMVVLRKIAGHCWKGYEAEDSLAKNECFSNILKEIETVPKDGRRYTEEIDRLRELLKSAYNLSVLIPRACSTIDRELAEQDWKVVEQIKEKIWDEIEAN